MIRGAARHDCAGEGHHTPKNWWVWLGQWGELGQMAIGDCRWGRGWWIAAVSWATRRCGRPPWCKRRCRRSNSRFGLNPREIVSKTYSKILEHTRTNFRLTRTNSKILFEYLRVLEQIFESLEHTFESLEHIFESLEQTFQSLERT